MKKLGEIILNDWENKVMSLFVGAFAFAIVAYGILTIESIQLSTQMAGV